MDLLRQDSKISHSKLSKKLKLHKNSVLYRVKRLKNLGIIKRFSLILNLNVIKKKTFYILLNLNTKSKEKILEYLKNHPLSLWVLELSGKWDVLVELICDDIEHFNDQLAAITNDLGNQILDYKTIIMYEPYKLEEGIDFVQITRPKSYKRSKNFVNLDIIDKKILSILCDNSESTYNEIAKKIGTTPVAAFYRIKKLLKSKVIEKFTPILDLDKLELQNYLLSLKLFNTDEKTFNSLKNYLANNKNVSFAFRTAGEVGVFIFCSYKNNNDFGNFLTNLKSSFNNIIKEQEMLIVNKVLKFNYFPKGLRK